MEKPDIKIGKNYMLEERVRSLEREVTLLKVQLTKLQEVVNGLIDKKEEEEDKKAILKEVPIHDPDRMKLLLEWTEFLLSRSGEKIKDVLEYYRSIGWISRKVQEYVLKVSSTMKVVQVKDFPDPEDHIKSLDYIKRLSE